MLDLNKIWSIVTSQPTIRFINEYTNHFNLYFDSVSCIEAAPMPHILRFDVSIPNELFIKFFKSAFFPSGHSTLLKTVDGMDMFIIRYHKEDNVNSNNMVCIGVKTPFGTVCSRYALDNHEHEYLAREIIDAHEAILDYAMYGSNIKDLLLKTRTARVRKE